jgi:hypothetical protein
LHTLPSHTWYKHISSVTAKMENHYKSMVYSRL